MKKIDTKTISIVAVSMLLLVGISYVILYGDYGDPEDDSWKYLAYGARMSISVPPDILIEDDTEFVLFVNAEDMTSTDKNIEYAVFTDISGNELPSETSYDDTTGLPYGYWVKVTSDDNIFMYFDFVEGTTLPEQTENPWDNYIGVWHLDETSGAYFDSTMNNHDSKNVNVVSRITENIGNCPRFGGSGNPSKIEFLSKSTIANTLETHGSLHVEFWISAINTQSEYSVINFQPHNETTYTLCANHGWNIECGWNQKDILIQRGEASRKITSGQVNNLENNTFYHVVVDYVPGDTVHIYYNGVECPSYAYSEERSTNWGRQYFQNWTATLNASVVLGQSGYTTNTGYALNGYLDEVRISATPMGQLHALNCYKNQEGSIPLIYGVVETKTHA